MSYKDINAYGGIYLFKNKINGKCYVGQHIGMDFEKRWKQHEKSHSKCVAIRNAIQKYGIDNFAVSVIAFCSGGQYLLDLLEINLIKDYNSLSPNGYNLNTGGSGGNKMSDESREKLRQSQMGHILTEQTKKKISVAHMGKKMSEEQRKKHSFNMKGRVFSPSHKKKIGDANRNRVVSEETKKKLSIAHTGKKMSEEMKKKTSINMKGNIISPEQRKKISLANSKTVYQFTKDKVFLKKWDIGAKAISQELNISLSGISATCLGKQKSCGGFIWRRTMEA